jgi:hypothetical protein
MSETSDTSWVTTYNTEDLPDQICDSLRRDVLGSIEMGLRGDAVFPWHGSPRRMFRIALAECIHDIEHHDRSELLTRFVRVGPYPDAGEIPAHEAERFVPDDETAKAINFIHATVVPVFEKRLATLLAIAPMLNLTRRLKEQDKLPGSTLVYVGGTVQIGRLEPARSKGVDIHLLQAAGGRLSVRGVGAVHSYAPRQKATNARVGRHLAAAAKGMLVAGRVYPARNVSITWPLQVDVVPTRWRQLRDLKPDEANRSLVRAELAEPLCDDETSRLEAKHWSIRLRWSQEALASAAHQLGFWHLEQIAQHADLAQVRSEAAAKKAVEAVLYYAILRARTQHERQRAIGFYNAHRFGYALGHNFIDKDGLKDALWPEDLHELRTKPKTAAGRTIAGWMPAAASTGTPFRSITPS